MSSPSRLQRDKPTPDFIQPWDRTEVSAKMRDQKYRLSKSSIDFGNQPTDYTTTTRRGYAEPSPPAPANGSNADAPQANKNKSVPAGITYNAMQGLYKNTSSVSLGSDLPEYVRSNAMPNLQETHSDWQEWRGKKDEVFTGLIRNSSLKLGSEDWFYKKSTMQEMLETSSKFGFEQDSEMRKKQAEKNRVLQMKLRRSQIQLGNDAESTDYTRSNAMPGYTSKQFRDSRIQQDDKLKAGLRKTNFVMGDERLMVTKSTMSEQFPVFTNDVDFKAQKLKQVELMNNLRRTQFSIGDGTPVVYKRTSDMKDWSKPETYERPRTPVL